MSLTHVTGRTGRIGHRGVATSFFTERDEPIADVLTRTLLETKQEIPDFLQQYVPEGDALKFETESDFDENDLGGGGGDSGGGGWGGDEAATTGDDAGGGWGAGGDEPAAAAEGGGWGAPAPASAWT